MKKIIKFGCILFVIGLLLTIAGFASGGTLYTSYWGGQLHTARESLSLGNVVIPMWQSDRWGRHGSGKNQTPLDENAVVSGLDFELGRGSYNIVNGDSYTVSGAGASNLNSYLDKNAVWHIELRDLTIKNDEVTITLPADIQLHEIDISAGASNITLESLYASEIDLELGAASVSIAALKCQDLSVEIGAGAADCAQIDAQEIDIEVGMGAFNGTLVGRSADYQYDADAGMGAVSLNGNMLAGGIGAKSSGGTGARMLDLSAGMGAIELHTED